MKEKIQIVILAGGVGKRMNNMVIPKVLMLFKGKPLIVHLLEAVDKTGLSPRPVVVISPKKELFSKILGSACTYVVQKSPLGTADAVKSAKPVVSSFSNIMVLYGDHPFLKPDTIKRLVTTHLSSRSFLTMGVVEVSDFNGWRRVFYDWGRIVRNKEGSLKAVVELKDASIEQRRIKEVNPSFFCFRSSWLWDNIGKIGNKNAVKEYYLPDLVKMAIDQKRKISLVEVKPEEAIGINTKEHLSFVNGSF